MQGGWDSEKKEVAVLIWMEAPSLVAVGVAVATAAAIATEEETIAAHSRMSRIRKTSKTHHVLPTRCRLQLRCSFLVQLRWSRSLYSHPPEQPQRWR